MAYQHAQAHLVRRQRNRNEEEDNGEVAVVTSIAIVTMPNTYTEKVIWVTQSEAPNTLLAPATRQRTTSAMDENKPTSTNRPATTSKRPSLAASSYAEKTSTTKAASTLILATKSPTPNSASTVVSLASATASAAVSATSTAEPSSGGMSGGAKAGLALGILFGFAALLVGILFLYGRKKKQMAAAKDNEKTVMQDATLHPPPSPLPPPPPPPQIETAPSFQAKRASSTAPRLSLKSLSNFTPTWSDNNKSGVNLLTAASATARSQDLSAEPERPTSAWERPGATNATSTPTNPFSDTQAYSNSPANNPFGNNAAVDAAQASIPDSPPSTSPLHSKAPSANFTNPAPVIAASDASLAVVTTASASAPLSNSGFPSPPRFKAVADATPPSPAWTEDSTLLASSTPVPVVVPVAGGRPNGPPPGPNNIHRVQQSFKPSMADELGLRAGALVRMLHEYDDGWALCINMDRSEQGVVPRTCLSKYPVKPRTSPPRQGPPQGPPPGMRLPIVSNGSPNSQPSSSANGHMSPALRSMSPGLNQKPPPHMQGAMRARSNSNAPFNGPPGSVPPNSRQMSHMQGPPRRRSNSSAPYAGPPRSMSPSPYRDGSQMAPSPQMNRRRSNSASQVGMHRAPVSGPSPMNPNAMGITVPRKPVPGMAL